MLPYQTANDVIDTVAGVFLERERQQTERIKAEAAAQSAAQAATSEIEIRKYIIFGGVALVAIAIILVKKRG